MPTTRPGLYSGQMNTANARKAASAMEQSSPANAPFIFTGDMNLQRTPQFFVRIFNVSDTEQRVERPWVTPKFSMNAGTVRRLGQILIIPACADGQLYSEPLILPDVVQQMVERAGSLEVSSRGVDGRFLAQDMLNPDDPRGNWRSVRPLSAAASINEGTNLYHWGCFWTTEETPTDEEVDTAKQRLEANYQRLIEEANLLHLQGAEGIKLIGATHRRAANYFFKNFGLEVDWNKRYRRQKECPGCGTLLNESVVVCSKCPAVFNWEKALELGLRSVEDAVKAGIMEPQAEQMGKKSKSKN